MSTTIALNLHQCQCQLCQQGEPHPKQAWHQQINLLMSRLDEQQRRWYAALEANRLGHGGNKLISQITGLDLNTIRRGRRELSDNLQDRPIDRVRVPGGQGGFLFPENNIWATEEDNQPSVWNQCLV